MNRGAIAVLLIVIAGGAGYAFSQWSSHPSSRKKTHQEVEDTTEPVAEERAPAVTLGRVEPTPGVASNHANAVPAQPKLVANSFEPRSDSERMAYAESVFDGQSFDPAWAPEATQRLSKSLSAVSIPGVRIRDLKCRSTLCKINIQADDKRAGEGSIKKLIRAMKWPGSGMAVMGEPDAQGGQPLTLFLARDGSTLPEPPTGP